MNHVAYIIHNLFIYLFLIFLDNDYAAYVYHEHDFWHTQDHICMPVSAALFTINNTPSPDVLLYAILPMISIETSQYMFTQHGSIKEHMSTALD